MSDKKQTPDIHTLKTDIPVTASTDFETRVSGGGPYLDVEQARHAEVLRAAIEGRLPDLDDATLHGVSLSDIPSVAPVEKAEIVQAAVDAEPGRPNYDDKDEKSHSKSSVQPTLDFDNPEATSFTVDDTQEKKSPKDAK